MAERRGFSIEEPGGRAGEHLARVLRQEVAALLGRRATTFPGAQPVSFSRRHIEQLRRQDYYVCEKSDGLRYLMYCMNDGPTEIIYLIDRRNNYFHVPDLHFPIPGKDGEAKFHSGTLIDGELVLDLMPDGRREPRYLVFDCLVLDGKSLMHRPLDKRLAYFRHHVFEPYQALYEKYPSEKEFLPFEMELKAMQFSYATEMMFRTVLPGLPHGNDGLIFTCKDTPYQPGTDEHILKWKPENENSVDFRIKLEFSKADASDGEIAQGITNSYLDYDSVPKVHLSVGGDNSNDRLYAELHLEDEEWEDLKALGQPLDDRIMECYMDERHRWRFMRFRDDKDKPNHHTTVESVIDSITDRVTADELIAAAKGIRDEWKAREAKIAMEAKIAREAMMGSGGAGKAANGTASAGTQGTKRKVEDD